MLELGQPGGDPRGHGLLQRVQHGVPLPRVGVVHLLQLGGKLQQPRQAVRPLERSAAVGVEVFHFLLNVGLNQAPGELSPRFGRERRARKDSDQPHQQPMPMHRGVPVVAAIKGRRQLARRLDIRIGVERMRDLVGILFVDAVQSQTRKPRRLSLIEVGAGDDDRAHQHPQHEQTDHPCILLPGVQWLANQNS